MTPAPRFRGRLWRWTKRLSLLTTLAVVAAIPAIGVGLPVAVRTDWVRHRAENALTDAFGAPVQIGGLSWRWKQGLTVDEIGSSESAPPSFRIDSVRVQLRYSKLFQGKLRLRVTLDKPELNLTDSSALRLPGLVEKGLRVERLDILDGTLTLPKRGEDRSFRLENVELRGCGRVEDRILRVDVASLSGACNGETFSGSGLLRLSTDGVGGEVELKDAAALELRDALRALNVTTRKAGPRSEPF